MKDMPKATEQRIVEALEKAVKIANEGSTPDEALVKVANDYEFPAEIVKRMVEAFNVSKTLSHLKNASDESRADSFPIASIENILGTLYPTEPETPAKKAAAERHPFYERGMDIDFMALSKEAKVTELPPLTDKKAEPYARDPNAIARAAQHTHEKLAKLHKKALDSYRHLYMKFFQTLDKAAAYWRATGPVEPFDLVEKRAVSNFGPLGKIAMDMVYEHGELGQKKLHVKRAAAEELGAQQMHYDDAREPYSTIADAVFLSEEIANLLKEAAAIADLKYEHAIMNINTLPPQPVMDAIDNLLKQAKKDMPGFTEQDRPEKVKEIYRALKRDHPDMPAEMKARIAARQGKKGKQKQGPPYKGPLAKKKKEKGEKKSHELDELFVKE